MSIPPPMGTGKVVTLALALLVASAVTSPPSVSAGPEVVCAWCVTLSDELGNSVHGFPNPADQCSGPMPAYDSECQRCGGTSSCHTIGSVLGDGPCNHVGCGVENLALVQTLFGEAIQAGDAATVSLLLAQHHEGFSIRYRPEAGRLELVVDCDPNVVATTYALLPSLKAQLHELTTIS